MLGDTLGGHYQSRLEEYLEAVDLEAIDLEGIDLEAIHLKAINLEAGIWRQKSGGGRSGGMCDGS